MNRFYRKRDKQLTSSETIFAFLDKMAERCGRANEARLARLWQNWSMVMGPELAELAWPLGQRNGMLLIGGEDPMAIQDLSLMSTEILERVNAFMESRFFREVKVGPCLGKTPLDSAYFSARQKPPENRPLPSAAKGIYLQDMSPESPVTRCYRAFCERGGQKPI